MGQVRAPVLVVGVYFTDRATRAEAIARELAKSQCWRVEQRWAALGGAPPASLASVTALFTSRAPKFTLINRLLEGTRIESFAHVLVVDDDVGLPSGFLDRSSPCGGVPLLPRAARPNARELHGPQVREPAHRHPRSRDPLRGRSAALFHGGRSPAAPPSIRRGLPHGGGYHLVWPITLSAAGLRLGLSTSSRSRTISGRRSPTTGSAMPRRRCSATWRSTKAWKPQKPSRSSVPTLSLVGGFRRFFGFDRAEVDKTFDQHCPGPSV